MTITLAPAALFQLLFYVLVLIFVVHAVVVAYHWLSFGATRHTSLLGIAIYIAIGAVFISTLAVSLIFIT